MNNTDSLPISRSKLAKPRPDNRIEFGQENLAEFIVGEIEKDPEVHIAINGPWGSGKTTILQDIREIFSERQSNFVTVWFEPWRYSPDQTTLRRTFLKKVSNDVSEQGVSIEPLDDRRFHFSRKKEKSRTYPEILGELFSSFFDQIKVAVVLLFLLAGLVVISFLAKVYLPILAGQAISSVVEFTIYIVILASILYFREDIFEMLGDLTTYEVKEPKISEIDLFEDEYIRLLEELDAEGKNLVILIDDIDRCNEDEIREVIIALSTYLDPENEGAPVSIVAAIDGPKIVRAFHTDASKASDYEKPNIIHKTFQFVIPAPSLSRANVADLIQATSDDLDYPLSAEDKEHIISVAVGHGASNPRIIRSAISDMVWMKNYGEDVLKEGSLKDSQSLNNVLRDDTALFRISLIKMLSENEDLRKIVTDAAMWLNEDRRDGSIEWEIFDYNPKFEPGSLDPRPLLALNLPNEYTADTYNFDQISDEAKNWNESGLSRAIENYDSATKVDLAYRLLDTDFDDLNQEQKANYLNSIIFLAVEGLEAIDEKRYNLFEGCFDELKSDAGIISHIPKSQYPRWFLLVEKLGADAINKLIDESSPFYQQDKQNFLSSISDESSEMNNRFVQAALRLEITEVKQNQHSQSANRARQLFTHEEIAMVANAPNYLIEVLENWSFGSDPDGPPETLLQSDVVELLSQEEYRERAINVFKKVGGSGPEGEDYLNILINRGWPTPQDYDVAEDNNDDANENGDEAED